MHQIYTKCIISRLKIIGLIYIVKYDILLLVVVLKVFSKHTHSDLIYTNIFLYLIVSYSDDPPKPSSIPEVIPIEHGKYLSKTLYSSSLSSF